MSELKHAGATEIKNTYPFFGGQAVYFEIDRVNIFELQKKIGFRFAKNLLVERMYSNRAHAGS